MSYANHFHSLNLIQVNGPLRDDHKLYTAWCVEDILAQINNGDTIESVTTLVWPDGPTLRVMDIFETVWECPPDRHMEVEDVLTILMTSS